MWGVSTARGWLRSGCSSGRRLGFGDVERHATEPAGVERLDGRVHVDQRPPCRVHDDRSAPHHGDRLGIDQMPVLVGEGHVKRDVVRLGDRLHKARGALGANVPLLQVRVDAHSLDPERPSPIDNAAPDSAHADHREPPALNPVHRSLGNLPIAVADREAGVMYAPRERQQQCHGVIGDLVETVVRDVGDEQPALGGGGDVDVVVADPVAGDDPAAGICRRGDHRLGDLRVADEHRLAVARRVDELLLARPGGQDQLGSDRLEDLRLGLEVGEDVIGYEDLGRHPGRPPPARARRARSRRTGAW